jgi:hypothetical protein
MHAYTHTYIYACVHAYIHTCKHTCIRTYMRACMHTYIRACMHACIHTYIHKYMRACMHAYIHSRMHTYIHAFINTYMCSYIHTYRVSREECKKLRESVPYVKIYRHNPKHLYPKLNGYGGKGQRKVWSTSGFQTLYLPADSVSCPSFSVVSLHHPLSL